MSTTLKDRWVGMATREKRIVKVGAWIVGVALFVGLLIEPALRNSALISKNLAAQRQDLATVRAYAEEARRLNSSGTGSNRAAVSDLKQELEKSVERANLGGTTKVTLAQQQATVSLTKVSFAALNDWLNSVPRELGVQVLRAKIERDAGAGLVSGELVFDGVANKK
jgi:general secretion pathway protein M